MECNFENCPNFERLGKKFADKISELEQENAELKAENDRLKEEIETRDNLVEHFRKEAINWAKISNDCIKDIEKYKQTLQEIKEFCKKEIEYFDNNDNYGQQADWIALLQKITKAEEE